MPSSESINLVTELIHERYHSRYDEEIADVILHDDTFDMFVEVLEHLGGGDQEQVADAFHRTAASLTGNQLDWMVGETGDGSQAENPASFLAGIAKEVVPPMKLV